MSFILFNLAGIAIVGWILMIFLPNWKITRAIVEWALFPVLIAVIYLVGLVPALLEAGPEIMADFGNTRGVQRLLADPDIAIVVWIHLLALDHLLGIFIYRDNMRERIISIPAQSALLLVCLMFAPLGFLIYYALRLGKKGPAILGAATAFAALLVPMQRASAQIPGAEQIAIPVGEFVFDAVVAGPEDGDLVILLHGFPQSNFEYRHQIPAVAAMGFRVLAPNQRGYSPGARPAGVEAYAMANLVNDVVSMAAWFGRDRFHVVGHDWGAAVAWYTALAYPDRVISVVALSVPHPFAFGEALRSPSGQQASMSGYMETFRAADAEERFLADDAAFLRSIYSGSGSTPAEIQVYLDLLGTPDAIGAALNWYRAMTVQGSMPTLTPIRMPTTYVWSTADFALGREGAELTEKYIEGPYRFAVLENIGHWIPEQAPDQLNEVLQEHFAPFKR